MLLVQFPEHPNTPDARRTPSSRRAPSAGSRAETSHRGDTRLETVAGSNGRSRRPSSATEPHPLSWSPDVIRTHPFRSLLSCSLCLVVPLSACRATSTEGSAPLEASAAPSMSSPPADSTPARAGEGPPVPSAESPSVDPHDADPTADEAPKVEPKSEEAASAKATSVKVSSANEVQEAQRTASPRPGRGQPCKPGAGHGHVPGSNARGNCQDGLSCCPHFQGRCGGAVRPDEDQSPGEPCKTTYRCAAVAQCWGPPPSKRRP